MKKNINKILLVGASVLLLSACSKDRFNILPTEQDTPTVIFTKQENYRAVVDGAYDYLKNLYSGDNGNMLVVGDALADNLIYHTAGRGTNKLVYEWSFDPDYYGVTGAYRVLYRVISRANLVLDNVPNVPSTQYMKNIEAEAKALRAISHFEIVRAYSKIPTQDANALNSLGIAYVTTFDPAQKPSREATVKETYNKILADLDFALKNINDDNGVGRINKAVVLGYLAKINLYLGDYAKVVEHGEKCIALKPSVGSLANFPNIWKDATEDGVLFTLLNANNSNDNDIIGTGFNQEFPNGIKSEFFASYGLVQAYKAGDIRKDAYITTSPYIGVNYNHVTKYDKRAGVSAASIVNVKVLRTADIYLTVAEAHLKASNKNEARALALLNTLREQRYNNYQAGNESGNTLLEAILEERRLELAFENDRFWTLKRLGKAVERSNHGSAVDGTGGDAPTGKLAILPAGDHRFVLPIPAVAIRTNSNIKQNPGY